MAENKQADFGEELFREIHTHSAAARVHSRSNMGVHMAVSIAEGSQLPESMCQVHMNIPILSTSGLIIMKTEPGSKLHEMGE